MNVDDFITGHNSLMELYKCSYIEIERNHLIRDKDYVSINPDECAFIKIGEKMISKNHSLTKEKITIKANYTGPINPDSYYNSNKRILFLLKEPYIERESFNIGDRGGHDQTKESIEDILQDSGNATYRGILKIIYKLFTGDNLRYENDTEKEKAIELYNNNACIINVNPFPGVVSPSKKKNSYNNHITKWAHINREFIIKQIKHYSPNIIYGANTINDFINTKDNISYELLEYKVIQLEVIEDNEPHLFKSLKNNVFIINGYHPAYGRFDKYFKDKFSKIYDAISIQ